MLLIYFPVQIYVGFSPGVENCCPHRSTENPMPIKFQLYVYIFFYFLSFGSACFYGSYGNSQWDKCSTRPKFKWIHCLATLRRILATGLGKTITHWTVCMQLVTVWLLYGSPCQTHKAGKGNMADSAAYLIGHAVVPNLISWTGRTTCMASL